MPSEWMSRKAEQEKSRRQDAKILREAINEFQQLLTAQIEKDLSEYNNFFPGERAFIVQENKPGCTVIRRFRDVTTTYTGILPEVESSFVLPKMILTCKFNYGDGLDKEFRLVMDESGKLGLAEGSLAELSEYLLCPILFDKLADGV